MIVDLHNYNSQVFDVSAIDKAMSFVRFLVEDSKDNDEYYNDVSISTDDGNNIVVSWVQVYYKFREDCGRFRYVGSDEQVMKEVILPDNHYEYVSSPKEEDDLWVDWIKEHPNWHKNDLGRWVEDEETLK